MPPACTLFPLFLQSWGLPVQRGRVCTAVWWHEWWTTEPSGGELWGWYRSQGGKQASLFKGTPWASHCKDGHPSFWGARRRPGSRQDRGWCVAEGVAGWLLNDAELTSRFHVRSEAAPGQGPSMTWFMKQEEEKHGDCAWHNRCPQTDAILLLKLMWKLLTTHVQLLE